MKCQGRHQSKLDWLGGELKSGSKKVGVNFSESLSPLLNWGREEKKTEGAEVLGTNGEFKDKEPRCLKS